VPASWRSAIRALTLVLVATATLTLPAAGPASADAGATVSPGGGSDSSVGGGAVGTLAQADDAEPRAQEATSDGTLPYRLLAISMAGLAGLLGVLTFWYWKATMPPARRGYLPPTEDRLRDRLGGRPPIDRVMEVDVARASTDGISDEDEAAAGTERPGSEDSDDGLGTGPDGGIIDFPL